jgi:hypothetical protein
MFVEAARAVSAQVKQEHLTQGLPAAIEHPGDGDQNRRPCGEVVFDAGSPA